MHAFDRGKKRKKERKEQAVHTYGFSQANNERKSRSTLRSSSQVFFFFFLLLVSFLSVETRAYSRLASYPAGIYVG